MLKNKSIYAKYLFNFNLVFFSPLPSLSAHNKCAQSWYTTVWMELKYILAVDGFPYFGTFVSQMFFGSFTNNG